MLMPNKTRTKTKKKKVQPKPKEIKPMTREKTKQ